ncbi:MAG: aminoacetone oxidase family FAD-binding enzyme [Spirochaeta sp.]|nr:aminoacetone oxidase family FAD-binding enzyme [Spirochaeta sp.]
MNSESYDVVVVGAGPAGLMAAGAAATAGARVLLLEKNRGPGHKLLISGGGRCNFTNAETDMHRLISRYDTAGKALFSPFARMGPAQVLEFFASHGMPYKIEDNKRAFPCSDKSNSVLQVLLDYIDKGNVTLRTHTTVKALRHDSDRVQGVELENSTIHAESVVVSTGGLARPDTGSTGDGFSWLEQMGHRVVRPEPSLVPVVVEEDWVTELQGLAFAELRISLRLGEKTITKTDGKVLFTHFGLSGPGILNLATRISQAAADAHNQGEPAPTISLNFFPTLDGGSLDRQLQNALSAYPRRRLRTILESMLPPRLARRVLAEALAHSGSGTGNTGGTDNEITASEVPKQLRKRIVARMQDFRLTYRELQSEDWAVVSSGGVPTDEIDFRSMESKLLRGLFVCGDMLNIDRPSGGYSLQICWATGYVAGLSAADAASVAHG